MDALSDLLATVRLNGGIFFDVHANGAWVAETPPGPALVDRMFPGAEHVIPYHVITRGTCWGGVIGETQVRLSAGDVIAFPHGDQHVLSSTPGMRQPPDLAMYRRPTDGQLPFTLAMGNTDGAAAHFVCGFMACDVQPFNPLLSALPRVIRVSDVAGGALNAFVNFAVAESNEPRPGGESVLGRLSELMFVDVVRRYLQTLAPDRTGWLAGLRDPFVGRALTAMHRAPSRAWTLDTLAREVGLSRSALAERFTHLVGQPAMQYLTNWRMQLAANHLRRGVESVAAVAERVGYESEAAFSRAFKKVVGTPPGQWRKDREGGRARNARLVGTAV
jgi:AraC-like DNA-binding protein